MRDNRGRESMFGAEGTTGSKAGWLLPALISQVLCSWNKVQGERSEEVRLEKQTGADGGGL